MIARKQPDHAEMTLREFCERYYFREVEIAPRTRNAVTHTLNRWERATDNPPIGTITADTIYAFRAACPGLKPATLNSHWYAVRTALNYAARRGVIVDVPKVRKIREKPLVGFIPTVEQFRALYRAADCAMWPQWGVPAPVAMRGWLCLMYFTGLRLHDTMHSLLWENLRDDSLTVVAKKTGKTHVFPLHPIFRAHLETLRGLDPVRIFPFPKAPSLLRRELRCLCTAAGLKMLVTPHSLRRFAATVWETAGGGAGGKLLGHSLGVTDRYVSAPRVLLNAVRHLEIPPEFRQNARGGRGRFERLAELDRQDSGLEYEAGDRCGYEWAEASATPRQLRRLSELLKSWGTWQGRLNAGRDTIAVEVALAITGCPDAAEAVEFWESLLQRVPDAEFVRGFVDGALRLLREYEFAA